MVWPKDATRVQWLLEVVVVVGYEARWWGGPVVMIEFCFWFVVLCMFWRKPSRDEFGEVI